MSTPAKITDSKQVHIAPVTFLWDFVIHYWRLLALTVVLVVLGRFDAVTYFTGPMFYLLEMNVVCVTCAVFAKHILFRATVDAYTEDQDLKDDKPTAFVDEWQKLDPRTRVILTIVTLCVFFFGNALIGASIAK